jgi:signal transduction histidine kinase
VRYRRADLAWAPLLVLSAGLSLSTMVGVTGAWMLPLMIVLAYPAGRRMVSFPLALLTFTSAAFAGLLLTFSQSADPLSDWIPLVGTEFVASVLPWWFGRHRRLRAEQIERERGIVADQARLRERARIAQDMHDSLGHELALIALHGGGLELATGLTDEQRAAAGELRACAVRATNRLHEIVQVLGSADAADALQPADESIDDVVRRAASAGVRVRLRHTGPAVAWSPMTSQAAHRVVQESLTNAARHAPGAPVTVTIARQDADTRIEVVNDLTARSGDGVGSGQGLLGLAERVRLVGGKLDAGPRQDGRWAVTTVLPDDAAPHHDDGQPAFELGVSRRLTRRRLRQTAMLPIGLGFMLFAALVIVQVVTGARTGLPTDRYDEMRPGQTRADVERLLPPHDIGREPRVVATPPHPDGAACFYYQVGNRLFEGGPDVYQLCFVGDVLVSKNRLEMA